MVTTVIASKKVSGPVKYPLSKTIDALGREIMANEKDSIQVMPDKVCLFFDTSSIYPGSEEDSFLSSRIKDYANLRDSVPYELFIYVPDIALKERRFQLRKKAIKKWDSAADSLQFLCQKPPLTREDAIQKICTNLETEIKTLGIDIIPLENSKIDIESICTDSIERKPPFSINGEKGFRDALILESITQYIATLPTTTKECHAIIICNDKLLLKAIEERGLPLGVELIPSHGEALNRLVALGQGMKYSMIQNILLKADELFMGRDFKSGLFCDNKLQEKISEEFGEKIIEPFNLKYNCYFEKEDFFISTSSLIKVTENIWHFVAFVEFQGSHCAAGYSKDIDYLESEIMKRKLKRQVLDPNDGFLSALLTKLTVTFRIDWRADRLADSSLSNASISKIIPYMRRDMGPGFMFSKKPELLGFVSFKENCQDYISLHRIDKRYHGYVSRPEWLKAGE